MQKKIFQTIIKISLASFVLAMSFQVMGIDAAGGGSLALVKDIMNRLNENRTSGTEHIVLFTTTNAVTGGADTNKVFISFPDAEDATWCDTAGVLLVAGDTSEGATALPSTSGLEANCTQGGVGTGDLISITKVDNLAAGTKYGVKILDNVGLLGTPGAGSDKKVTVFTNNGFATVDTGSLALSIVANDQVTVTANVDPTFTFAIYRPGTTTPTSYCWSAGNTVQGFGTISPASANVDTCEYDIYTNTNASSGYVTTLVAIDDGSGGNGRYALNNDAMPTNFFDPEDGDNAVVGSQTIASEYGIGSSEAEFIFLFPPPYPVPVETTCDEDASVDARSLYDATGVTPVLTLVAYHGTSGAETNTVCHAAAAGVTTPSAGNYTQTVTIISTGRF